MTATRQDVRKRLATLARETSEFDKVFDHAPLDLRGLNRVLCIYSDRSRHEMISRDLNNDFYRFTLETYALRRVDESGAEDAIDEMHEAIRAMVRNNVGDLLWNEIFLEEDSDPLFAQIATEPYRVERHFVLIKVTR